jgi:hypothetical protein
MNHVGSVQNDKIMTHLYYPTIFLAEVIKPPHTHTQKKESRAGYIWVEIWTWDGATLQHRGHIKTLL